MAEERHIYQYDTVSEFDSAELQGGMNVPWASYIIQTDELKCKTREGLRHEYFGTTLLEDGTITLNIGSSVNPTGTNRVENISYAVGEDKDNNVWTTVTNVASAVVLVEVPALAGQTIYWKGVGTVLWAGANMGIARGGQGCIFYSDCNFTIHGNILSLFYGDNFANNTKMGSIKGLFYQCTTLVDAGNLLLGNPVGGQGSYHLESMFNGCTSLVRAPQWWADEVYTNNSAGSSWFSNCTSLKYIPKATIIGTGLSNSFYNCVSLEDASMLTLKQYENTAYNNAYTGVFSGCTSLKKPPKIETPLPSEEHASIQNVYRGMYENCKELISVSIPGVYKTAYADSGGGNLFRYLCNGCSKLKWIRACWTANIPQNYIASGVAEYGQFVKNGASKWKGHGNFPVKWDIKWEDGIDISDNYQTLVFDMDEGDTMTYRVYAYPAPTVTIDSNYTSNLSYTMTTDVDNPNMHDITFSLGSTVPDAGTQIPVVIGNDEGNFTVIVGLYDASHPYDAEVEYIEHNAAEYINTEYVPTGTDIRIEGKVYPTSYNGSWASWTGASANDTTEGFNIRRNNNSNTEFRYSNSALNTSYGTVTDVALNTEHVFSLSYGQLILDGTTYTYTPTETTTVNTSSLCLFRVLQNTSYTRGRFYYLKVYKSDTLVIDLIPVRRAGGGCMYDRVSGKVFSNAGTGTMGYGADVTSGE